MYEISETTPPVNTLPVAPLPSGAILNFSGLIPAKIEAPVADERRLGIAILLPYKSTIKLSPSLPLTVPGIKLD
ncbi:unannotated protein [freshwater metagenome]|uniref:Unannotated protein n=1 Tax=freshwater metagenome TaxID=449393 RepID=A0A6J6F5G5_9ZZZZ